MRRAIFLALGLVVLVLAPLGQGNYIVLILSSWLMFTIAAMGLNLTLGYAGQISLAQASFMAIGAYITAIMTLAGLPWLLGVAASVVVTFFVGLLVGFPALRVTGHFLAFVTLAFNQIVVLVLRNEDWLTGGSYGKFNMPRPDFLVWKAQSNLDMYYVILAVFVIFAALMFSLIRSPWGRAFKALRENPVRAQSLGVNTTRITLLAFAVGSAAGGLAGAIMSPLVQFIEPNAFALVHSLKILLMVVVGGAGYFFGPMLGAAVVILLPEVLRFTEGYYLMIYAALVIVLMVYSPAGLIGIGAKLRDRLWPKTQVRKDMEKGSQL
jgi:branched-chain amino acid transport system permease protein